MNSNSGDKPALPHCCLHGRICFPSGVGVVRVSPGSRGGRLGWGFCLPRGEQSDGTPASAQLEPCTRVYTEFRHPDPGQLSRPGGGVPEPGQPRPYGDWKSPWIMS